MSGADRIEMWEALGRPMRVGSAEELAVSDGERIRSALGRGDLADALGRSAYLEAGFGVVMTGYVEWCLSWPGTLARHVADVEIATDTALGLWHPEEEAMREVLRREDLDAGAGERFREVLASGAIPDAAARMLAGPRQAYETFTAAPSEEAYETWIETLRRRHDDCGLFVAAYGRAVLELHGQALAEQVQAESFTGMSLYPMLWAPVPALSSEQLAVLLADHLRFHFSGAGRDGQVRIVEEEDRYRVIMDVCGSGGVLRRKGITTALPEASDVTWGRAGEVPLYCSHCALNESESVKRLGYKAWETEFDPDPTRPCAWTVPKRPPA